MTQQQDLFPNDCHGEVSREEFRQYKLHGEKPSAALKKILLTDPRDFIDPEVGDLPEYWPLAELRDEAWGSEEAIELWMIRRGEEGPANPIKRLIARDLERRRLSVTNAAVSAGYGAAA